MFYTTQANDHGFPHDPFKAIVTPRPIGWIGSIDKDGVANLAPHSYFNAISDNPYFVIFGSTGTDEEFIASNISSETKEQVKSPVSSILRTVSL